MTIRAVIFDIGGVLEFTPNLNVAAKWEQVFGLKPGELDKKLGCVWSDGSVGKISEEEVHQQIGEILAMSQEQVAAFMEDIWQEYLGTLNVELAEFFRGLRPRVRTAIISNSFIGAREREQACYHFEDMCDFILYSHEEGISKPNPQIFERAWCRLGLQPSEIIFLDDHGPNIAAARTLGIHAILFKNNAQAMEEILTSL